MKSKLLTLSLIAVSITAMAQYHIRVECFGPSEVYQYYAISYTNDNWKTHQNLNKIRVYQEYFTTAIDDYREYTDCEIFPVLEESRNALIDMARQFKTYSDVQKYNTGISTEYHRLHEYYFKIRPKITPFKSPIKKKQCCKLTNIY